MLYDDNSLQLAKLGAIVRLRPGLYDYGTVKLTGSWVQASDSLLSLDSNFLAKEKNTNISLSVYVDYAYDTRNSKSYPLMGNNLKVYLNKLGLGLWSKDVDYFYYGIDFRFYQKLGNKWYVAEMLKLENSSSEDIPYYYQLDMNSKKDFIRGYDLFALRGDAMNYFRSNLKYELVFRFEY